MYNTFKPRKNYSVNLLPIGLFLIVCLILWGISCLPVHESAELPRFNTVVLNDQQGKYPLGKSLQILVDPTKELTITDVAQAQQKFTPSHSDIPNMGFNKSAIWAKVKLHNQSNINYQWYLKAAPSNVDYVELYIPEENTWIKKQTGRSLPFSIRELKERNLMFKLPLQVGEEKTIYLRYINQGTLAIDAILWRPLTYYENNLITQVFLGGFYGILLTLVTINLLLLFILKDVNYQYYVFFLIGFASVIFIKDGFALKYVWSESPQWNFAALLISIGIGLASATSFFISFLPVRRYNHQLYQVMIWFRWVCVGFLCIAWLLPFRNSIIAAQILVICLSGLMNYACFYTWYKGFIPARFAILGWGCLFLGITVWAIKSFGILPVNLFTEEFMRVGTIGFVFFLAIALADKINLLKEQYNQIESEQQKLALIVENSSEFVSINHIDGQVIFINNAGKEIIGFNKNINDAKLNILDYFYPEDRIFFESHIWETVLKTGHWQGEIKLYNWKIEQIIDTSSYFFLIHDQKTGKPTAFASIIHDISKLKQAENDILASLEKEKTVSKMRSRFITMASHEIRTPLAIISSSTGILQNFGDRLNAEKKQQHLQTIQDTIKSMTQLLDDILMINRAETEKMAFNPESGDIIGFCHSLKTEIESSSSKHTIDFSLDVGEEMAENTLMLQFDKKLLQQILTNLLLNAIKFSPEHDLIKFSLSRNNNQLIFTISDYGIGIPAAEQANLFAPFYRGSNVSNISGTGLGLSIVKKSLDLHKGEINIQSQEGEGTICTVKLPFVPVD
jgi:two-component system, sensor histidine kinase LadS